ncbi:MAG TPA: VWA domain-containing protein [Candidatus Limnocylindrales bacterium]|jgi:Mg-chelatase subunit ChlD|nr:VWA domain-containing protein [Candidatus Limnocylindrales bacterium]
MMKELLSLAFLTVLCLGALQSASLCAAEEEGVALAIIYDTSGSMRDPVADQTGGAAPKYVIANRALKAVANQIQAFATNSAKGSARKIYTGLFTFEGEHARVAVPMKAFDRDVLRNWADHFSNPSGNTPLGNTLNAAGRAVLDTHLARKHVLVITDGINTAGPPPATVLPKLKQQATQQGTSLSVHFVAFDVDAKVFDPLKKQGATVVAAGDEKQLNSQLQYILQQKILLEDEETPQKK